MASSKPMQQVLHTIITVRQPLAWFMSLTLVFGAMFCLVQQQNRLSANDMPTMLASETARYIESGVDVQALGSAGPVEITTTRVPFTIIFDKNGKPVSGTGYDGKKLAQIPVDVLKAAQPGELHAVTWEPKAGLRFATVTVQAKDYYVTAGQSLAPVDARTSRLFVTTLVGYGLALLTMAGYYALAVPGQAAARRKHKSRK